MILYQGQPPTTTAELYVADRRIISYTVVLANLTAADATVRINHGRAGAVAADTNVVIPDLSIGGNEVVAIDLPLELASGDVLHGNQGTAAAVTVTIDGTDGTQQ